MLKRINKSIAILFSSENTACLPPSECKISSM